jgi:hypothetical protein
MLSHRVILLAFDFFLNSTHSSSVQIIARIGPHVRHCTPLSMPGHKWTDPEVDLPFLLDKIPGYSNVYTTGKARVKNNARDAYLNQTMAQYIQQFPGRVNSMDLPGIGLGESDAKRNEVFKEVSACFVDKERTH